jgi:hypothetical protein
VKLLDGRLHFAAHDLAEAKKEEKTEIRERAEGFGSLELVWISVASGSGGKHLGSFVESSFSTPETRRPDRYFRRQPAIQRRSGSLSLQSARSAW